MFFWQKQGKKGNTDYKLRKVPPPYPLPEANSGLRKGVLGYAFLFLFLLFCIAFVNQDICHAEKLVHTTNEYQKVELHRKDLGKWIQMPYSFTSLAVEAEGMPFLEVMFNPAKPEKKEVVFEDDEYSELMFTNPTKKFAFTTDYQLQTTNYPLTVYLFNTQEKPLADASYVAGKTDLDGLKVIARNQWGADENLRYYEPDEEDEDSSGSYYLTPTCQAAVDNYPQEFKYDKVVSTENGNHLTWPLQYSPAIKKIVVHHTGETNVTNGRPSDEMMRAIYYYHTVVKGWGDIGYHYVIGKDGEVYEGKAGNNQVVGAHVYCNNIGTIGVSVMGNFQKEKPSTKQLNSLKAVLSKLTQTYNLKATEKSTFHGKNLYNVVGHKDLAATACPGENLYALMPSIRTEVAKGFTYKFTDENESTTQKKDYQAEVTQKIDVLKLDPTHQTKIKLKFKNTGKQTWNNETWLHVALNSNTNAWADSIAPDKKFVAADMNETTVKPGKIATFDVTINAGYKAGFYILEFAPVVNNKYKLSSAAILQPIDIPEPNYTYDFVKAEHPPNPFYAGQPAEAWVKLKNTGNIVWRNYGENKIYLGTSNPQDRKSLFSTDGRRTRVGYLKEREVEPGETGMFIMPLTAPDRAGIYRESFAPVIEGVKWLEDRGMQFRIIVKEPKHQIEFTTKTTTLNLDPDTQKTFTITYQNLSDVSWEEDEIYFMLAGDYRALGIEDNVIRLDEPLLKNKKGSFRLPLQTPSQRNLYNLSIVPVIRGKKFEDAAPFNLRVLVKKPNASGEVVNRVPKTVNLDLDESDVITIKVKNTGNITWRKEGQNQTSLVPINQRSRIYVKDKWESRTTVSYLKETSVKPGRIGTFTLYAKPKYKGYYSDVYKVNILGVGQARGVTIPFRIKAGNVTPAKKTSAGEQITDNSQHEEEMTDNSRQLTDVSNKQTQESKAEVNKVNKSEDQTEEGLIRVRLSVPASASLRLTADGTFEIKDSADRDLFEGKQGEEFTVKKSGNYLYVEKDGKSKTTKVLRFEPQSGAIMEISSWEHRPGWNQDLNDNQFRGTLELRIVDDEIAVINELPLEDYLKGIAEVSNGDPEEKLKTMAVLARTYALFYMQPENEKFPGKPYDASDDPAIFQKYLGYGLEKRSPNFIKALEATKGEVVSYEGELVKTPYFNQSDGKTLSAGEVWGWTHTPYLISVNDPACSGMSRKGHGVGLSGYGATQMAKEGKSYTEIIQYYYQGVEVETL